MGWSPKHSLLLLHLPICVLPLPNPQGVWAHGGWTESRTPVICPMSGAREFSCFINTIDIWGAIILYCWGCPVHCRMFIPGLYLQDDSSTHIPSVITIIKSPDIAKCLPWAKIIPSWESLRCPSEYTFQDLNQYTQRVPPNLLGKLPQVPSVSLEIH